MFLFYFIPLSSIFSLHMLLYVARGNLFTSVNMGEYRNVMNMIDSPIEYVMGQ